MFFFADCINDANSVRSQRGRSKWRSGGQVKIGGLGASPRKKRMLIFLRTLFVQKLPPLLQLLWQYKTIKQLYRYTSVCIISFSSLNGVFSSSDGWSSDGCEVAGINATHTICSCRHLSLFAVLLPSSSLLVHMPMYLYTIMCMHLTWKRLLIS